MSWNTGTGEHFIASNPASFAGLVGNLQGINGAWIDAVLLPKNRQDIRYYGVLCDGTRPTDVAITTGTAILTSGLGGLKDVNGNALKAGMIVAVPGAGAAGATFTAAVLASPVPTVNSVTLDANAGTTVNNVEAYVGTDNTTALQAAWNDAANWQNLWHPRGLICIRGTLLMPVNAFKSYLGAGDSEADQAASILGTCILQMTDNIPVVKVGTTLTHTITWDGIGLAFAGYQSAAQTNGYGLMFGNNVNATFFHWRCGRITVARSYVAIGIDQVGSGGKTITAWNMDFQHARLVHTKHNAIQWNSPVASGMPNVHFGHLYISNTGGPVVSDGDAISTGAAEVLVDQLDLEGWATRLLNAFGNNVTLRKVHIENGTVSAVNDQFRMSDSILTVDDISYTVTSQSGGPDTLIFYIINGGKARIRGFKGGATLTSGTISFAGSDGTGLISVDGYLNADGHITYPVRASLAASTALVLIQEDRQLQTPAYSATPAPDPSLGSHFHPAVATGAIAVANPPKAWKGARLYMQWDQDGVGGRALTYPGANWRATGIAAQVTTLGTTTIDEAYCIDGTIWRVTRLVTGQTI